MVLGLPSFTRDGRGRFWPTATAVGFACAAILAPTAQAAEGDASHVIVGACEPTSVAAQEYDAAVIAVPAHERQTIQEVTIEVSWSGPRNEDIVLGVIGPDEAGVPLVVEGVGSGGSVLFTDAATAVDPGAGYTGEMRGEGSLAELKGLATTGPWSLAVLNLSDEAALRVESCELRMSVSEAPVLLPGPGPTPTASPTPTAPPTSPPSSTPSASAGEPGQGGGTPGSAPGATPGGTLAMTGVDASVLVLWTLLGVGSLSLGVCLVRWSHRSGPGAGTGRRSRHLAFGVAGGLVLAVALTPTEAAHAQEEGYPLEGVWSGTISIAQDVTSDYRLQPEGSSLVRSWGEVSSRYEFDIVIAGTEDGTWGTGSDGELGQFVVTELQYAENANRVVQQDPDPSCIATEDVAMSNGRGEFTSNMWPFSTANEPAVDLIGLSFGISTGYYDRDIDARADVSIVQGNPDCDYGVVGQRDALYGPLTWCESPFGASHFFPATFLQRVLEADGLGGEVERTVIRGSHTRSDCGDYITGSSTIDLDLRFHPGATYTRLDSDGDGIPDTVDPCPLDPTNTCEAPHCKPVEVAVDGDIASLPWFGFSATAKACDAVVAPEEPPLSMGTVFGEVKLPPATLGIMSTVFEPRYSPESSEVVEDEAGSLVARGAFQLCALSPLDFLPVGKLASGVGKAISWIARKAPDRLAGKAASYLVRQFNDQVLLVAAQLGLGFNLFGDAAAARHVSEQLTTAFSEMLTAGFDAAVGWQMCVPMWDIEVTMVPRIDGPGVIYDILSGGIADPVVTHQLNATPL